MVKFEDVPNSYGDLNGWKAGEPIPAISSHKRGEVGEEGKKEG